MRRFDGPEWRLDKDKGEGGRSVFRDAIIRYSPGEKTKTNEEYCLTLDRHINTSAEHLIYPSCLVSST